MTINLLLYLATILYILSFCDCGESTTNSDTSPNLMIDLKKDIREFRNITFLEGEPGIIQTNSFYVNYALYNNTELSIEETNVQYIFNIHINDISPGKKNYTFLILYGYSSSKKANYKDHTYQPIYYELTFHVRLKKTPLTVAINDAILKTERTNLTVTDYDAVATYKFREGELVDISCGKHDEHGKIFLKYQDMETKADYSTSLETDYTLSLLVKLESMDANQYFTCGIQNDKDYAIVRVYFSKETEPEEDIAVQVNGLKLRRQLTSSAKANQVRELSFSYKFNAGDIVKLEFEIKKGLVGMLRSKSGIKIHRNDTRYTATQKLTEILTLPFEFQYENGTKLEVDIHFHPERMQDFYILGLRPDQIKHKYLSNSTVNNKQVTIDSQYQYHHGESLQLTFMKNPKTTKKWVYKLMWIYQSSTSNVSILNGTESKPITNSFYLTSASNDSVLECLAYEHLVNSFEPDDKLRYRIVVKFTMMAVSSTTIAPPTTPEEDKIIIIGNEDPKKYIIWGIGGGLCILILIMIIMVYSISKRKSHRKRDSNINYENLPHNNDNTIPNPSQWNEEQYARPVDLREDSDTYSVPYNQKNLEKLYAKPQPKILRNKIKTKETNNYVNEEPTYSEVGKLNVKDCDDPNYAQVVPKSLRNNLRADDKNNYANTTGSSNYAQVLPKNQRINEKKNYVLPKDGSNYAEIAAAVLKNANKNNDYVNLNKESAYAEIVHSVDGRNKYVNVISNNEPYANVNSSDYAEPAYCELNIKKNKK